MRSRTLAGSGPPATASTSARWTAVPGSASKRWSTASDTVQGISSTPPRTSSSVKKGLPCVRSCSAAASASAPRASTIACTPASDRGPSRSSKASAWRSSSATRRLCSLPTGWLPSRYVAITRTGAACRRSSAKGRAATPTGSRKWRSSTTSTSGDRSARARQASATPAPSSRGGSVLSARVPTRASNGAAQERSDWCPPTYSTCHPSGSVSTNSRQSRVLPTPASPVTSTSRAPRTAHSLAVPERARSSGSRSTSTGQGPRTAPIEEGC